VVVVSADVADGEVLAVVALHGVAAFIGVNGVVAGSTVDLAVAAVDGVVKCPTAQDVVTGSAGPNRPASPVGARGSMPDEASNTCLRQGSP
jgi:hypothetical protein